MSCDPSVEPLLFASSGPGGLAHVDVLLGALIATHYFATPIVPPVTQSRRRQSFLPRCALETSVTTERQVRQVIIASTSAPTAWTFQCEIVVPA